MKKIVLSLLILLLLLTALLTLTSCSKDDENVDGPMVKDAYGFWRPETCWLSECLILPEISDTAELFGAGGASGLVSDKALAKDGQLGADGQGYLVCLFYGTHPEGGVISSRLRLSLVNGTQILVDGEGVTFGDVSAHTTGVKAALDMSKPADKRLAVTCEGETVQGAVVIPFTVNSPGKLYATFGLEMGNVSTNTTVEDKGMATLAAKTSYNVSVDSVSIRYLTQDAYADGVYTEEDLVSAPSLSGGDNCYAVVDLSYTATNENDGDQYFNVLAYIPGRGVLDVTVEAAPTSRVTELNTTGGIAVSAAFSVPRAEGEQKTVRLLLRLLPVSGGDAEMDIFLSCSESTALTGDTYFNNSYNTGEPTLEYTISEDGKYYTVTKILSDSLRSVTIPDELGDGVPVTGFTEGLFRGNKNIQYLTIGNGVTHIAAGAFENCSELRSVTMGTGVTFIGADAFKGCLRLRASGLFISDLEAWCRVELENAFSNPLYYTSGFFLNGERITQLVIPYGIEYIGNYAFYTKEGTGGYITKIVIPNTVKTIGDYAFAGWNQYETLTLSASLTAIGERAFYKGASLPSVAIPNGVTSIGDGAFMKCNGLKTVSIPSGITYIGRDAFAECESLVYTEYENACYLGNANDPYIFLARGKDSSVTACSIPATTKTISYDAFYKCAALQSITVAAENATYCAIDGVLYSKDGTKLVQYPQGKPDTVFTVPSGVTHIEPYAFYLCRILKELTVGTTVTHLGAYAFYQSSSITEVSLCGSVSTVGAYAFAECKALRHVDLGGVKTVGERAFENCVRLESADNTESVTEFGVGAFIGCTVLADFCFGDGLTVIPDALLAYCSSIKSIVIGNNVTTIGEGAFSNCNQLETLTIGEGVTAIGKAAFDHCKALTTMVFNAACVTEFGAFVFRCAGQSGSGMQVTIGATVTAIPNAMFYCSEFSNTSENSVYVVSVEFEQGSACTRIGDKAFYGCRFESITIPNGVTHIGREAFFSNRLKTAVLPKTLTYIDYYAFNCTKISFQGSVAEWKAISKDNYCLGSMRCEVACAEGSVYYFNGVSYDKD